MHFSQKPEKILKIHLNPHHKSVQKLLKLGAETNMISFHFYDIGANLVSSAITEFSDSETNWFGRNQVLSSKLISDWRGYNFIEDYLQSEVAVTDRFFKQHKKSRAAYFIREGCKVVGLGKI